MVVRLSLLISVGGIFRIMQTVQTDSTAQTVQLYRPYCNFVGKSLSRSFCTYTVHPTRSVVAASCSKPHDILRCAYGTHSLYSYSCALFRTCFHARVCRHGRQHCLSCLCCLRCTYCPESFLTSYLCGQHRPQRPYCMLFISFRDPSVSRQRRTPVLSAVPHAL